MNAFSWPLALCVLDKLGRCLCLCPQCRGNLGCSLCLWPVTSTVKCTCLSHKEEGNFVICSNVDELEGYYAK